MAKRRRRTLRDVAVAVGVSEMTVSRVLRGKGAVAERTRTRVLRAIDELGYVPSQVEGPLLSAHANQVAVIIPSLIHNVFSEVLAGIADELDKAGYNAVIGISEYDLAIEEKLLTSMLSWRPAGVIVTHLVHSERSRTILANADVPVVEMMDCGGEPIDLCVGLDHSVAARTLVDYLLRRDYRRFGYLGWNTNDFAAASRFEAVRQRLATAGLDLVAPNVFDKPPDLADGKTALARLLRAHDLDVVMFSNDTAATGAVLHCLEHGIRMPEDLAIVGFSGLRSAQALARPLTTLNTKRFEIGRRSARAVLNRLAGQDVERRQDLGFELVPGATA